MRFESTVTQLTYDIWRLKLEILWLHVSYRTKLALNSLEQFIYS